MAHDSSIRAECFARLRADLADALCNDPHGRIIAMPGRPSERLTAAELLLDQFADAPERDRHGNRIDPFRDAFEILRALVNESEPLHVLQTRAQLLFSLAAAKHARAHAEDMADEISEGAEA